MKKGYMLFFLSYFLISIFSYSQYSIAVVPKGNINQFWKEIKEGVINAQRVYDVDVIYRGPSVEAKVDLQIRVIENFINQNVDAIVIAPSHKNKLVSVIKKAVAKGIKIVIIDSEISGNYHDAFIATDNYKAGRKAGEEFVKLIKKKKAGVLRERKGNASTDKREQGFIDVLTENNIEIAVDKYGGAVFGDRLLKFEKVLKNNPDVKGYFCPGEIGTLALKRAIESSKKKSELIFVSFDYNQEIQEGIDNGIISGTVIQRPKYMGFLGVKTAVDLLNGKKVEKTILIDADYINKKM